MGIVCYALRSVPADRSNAGCISWLPKLPASSYNGQLLDEYVNGANAKPHATMTAELKRASADNEELIKVRKCWKTGDWSQSPSWFKMVRNQVTVLGKLVGTRISCVGGY